MSSLTYDLTLAGLSVGSAAALTGIGLVVTYRATGVLNFAHGAIAMVCAYALRQCVVVWGWPLWLGAVVTLVVLAPAIGVVLERFVFRPLAVLGGDPARTLVASLGVFVLLVGGAVLLWGQGARDDAPQLVSADPWGQLAVALLLAAGVSAVIRWTRFGRELRAVVDDRQLAVLGGIDADRVAAAGWAFGAFTAGLTGALLAPYVRLDPYGLPLLVMEVVAVAVAARMRSLPVAVVVALGVGIAQSQLTRWHPTGWAQPLLQAVGANLFVVALLVAALVLPGIGRRDTPPRPPAVRAPAVPHGAWIVAVVLFLLPLGLAGPDLRTAVQVPALGIVLLSLVVVTGRGGQISLGQAAYAGLGALFTALLAAGRFPLLPPLPELTALAVAVVLVAPLGLLTGWPAIGRQGLALALATFAVGVGVSRFVFAQPYATSGLSLGRPAGFDGDRAYYLLELVLLAAALLATRLLRQGRTGRALAAMRDHEAGASAAGVRVPSLKLLAFVSGAALAALGGGLLGMGLRAFDPGTYDPVRGLLWFAAVVVLGADSTLGALAAAALLVGLDAGTRGGVAAALVGVLAVCVGRFPDGPYETARAAAHRMRRRTDAHLTPLGARVRTRLRPTAERPPRRGVVTGVTGVSVLVGGGGAAGTGGGSGGAGGGSGGAGSTGGPGSRGGPASTGGRGPAGGRGSPGDSAGAGGPDFAGSGGAGGYRGCPGDLGSPDFAGSEGAGDGQGSPGGSGAGGGAGAGGDSGAWGGSNGSSAGSETSGSAGPDSAGGWSSPGARAGVGGGRACPGAGAGAGAPVGRRARGVGVGPVRGPEPREAGPPAASRMSWAGGGRWDGGAAAVLGARGLRVRYGGFTALDGVDLEVARGRVTAVVGPNGAGKSTLFHCLAGTVRPVRGQVLFMGRDVTRLPAHARTRLGIARTFQQLAVFPSLTVAENVRIGAEQGRVNDPGAVERALRLFGLDGPLRALPAAGLPTGTLRRVELARALAGGPRVLLLDEPAAGLDTAEVAAMARVLRALAADGVALLVVEHDLDLVAGLADVVHVMTAGRVVATGPPGRVLDALGAPAGQEPGP
ncbi:ATP-binding cassette domain-containing protein [Streptomyces sp. NPDC014776]|uniref:ABC transporter permease subunit n=1 Tax=Streptomyces sp. NPDC014776 TaxID=3364909 RepID=UPI0036F84EC6